MLESEQWAQERARIARRQARSKRPRVVTLWDAAVALAGVSALVWLTLGHH